MKENIRRNLKNTNGITLVALVVTIIVLLILAGVALSSVLSQDGIFSRAEQTTDKYGQAKARETLELALGEAQMQKYEEGLTEEQLDNKINEIGELLPKENPDPNLQNAIVDGHIFEIDRSVPKIVDYIGPADGVIITANVSGNNGWQKPGNAKVTISGTIKTYSGGTIISSSAKATNGVTILSDFPTTGGNYTIEVTEDTTIEIKAKDSNNKENSKTIPVTIRVDNILPTIDTIDAKAEGLTIKFSVTGTDEQSGIKYFKYKISSTQDTTLEGLLEDKREGTFSLGQTVEIETTPTEDREETTYTITVNAVDNCDNTSTAKAENVITIDGITVVQAKELVNKDTLQRYIGTRITDYTPEAGGTWRVFYYDAEDDGNGNGYFGPKNTLYLKRDYSENQITGGHNSNSNLAIEIMKKMNPKWANSSYNEIDLTNEKNVKYLCDPNEWIRYKVEGISSYAIGSPSVEMYMKAYNVWQQNDPNGTALICKVENVNGYSVGKDGKYGTNEYATSGIIGGKGNVFAVANWTWLASPSCFDSNATINIRAGGSIAYANTASFGAVCPIVPLDL